MIRRVPENGKESSTRFTGDEKKRLRNSIEFYLALKKFNIPAEMHIFREGGHGFGMNKQNLPIDNWTVMFVQWLKAQAITK